MFLVDAFIYESEWVSHSGPLRVKDLTFGTGMDILAFQLRMFSLDCYNYINTITALNLRIYKNLVEKIWNSNQKEKKITGPAGIRTGLNCVEVSYPYP